MVWHEELFVGKSVNPRRKKRMIRKINKRSILNRAYLITLPANTDNLLDIIDAKVVRRRGYPDQNLYIIGLAGSYEEAVTLAAEILYSYYLACGDFRLQECIQYSRERFK